MEAGNFPPRMDILDSKLDPIVGDYHSAFVENPRREELLEARDVALVCIDVQYLDAAPGYGVFRHLDPEAELPESEKYYFERLNQVVLPNMAYLQQMFRSARLEVMHCRICALTQDGRDRSAGHKRLKLLATPGSKEAEFMPQVAPKDDEIVLDKTASGVFSSTNFHYVLRNLGVRLLYLTGVYTNECVETAARDACDLGYFVTVVDDACATVTPRLHESSLHCLRDRYARIATTEEVIEEMKDIPLLRRRLASSA
jgi:nicotinamidase-related amidase